MKNLPIFAALLFAAISPQLKADPDKSIATVKQESSSQVYAYDQHGNYMFAVSGELVGYTGSTVTVKPNHSSNQVYVYDEKGHYKFAK